MLLADDRFLADVAQLFKLESLAEGKMLLFPAVDFLFRLGLTVDRLSIHRNNREICCFFAVI